MRIIKTKDFMPGYSEVITVDRAIAEKLYPSAYSYDGPIEKLQVHIELQSEMIVKLVTLISGKLNVSVEDMEELLGSGYNIVE